MQNTLLGPADGTKLKKYSPGLSSSMLMLAFASPGLPAAMLKVQVRIKWLSHEREDLCTFINEK